MPYSIQTGPVKRQASSRPEVVDHPHDHGATAVVAADREDLASLARLDRLAYPSLTGQRLQGRRDDLPDRILGLRSTGVHHLALVRTRAEFGPVEAARAFQVSIALASSQCSLTTADQSGIFSVRQCISRNALLELSPLREDLPRLGAPRLGTFIYTRPSLSLRHPAGSVADLRRQHLALCCDDDENSNLQTTRTSRKN